MPAIRVISQEVMLPRGLVGLGLDTLDQSREEVFQALSLYTSTQSMPSVVHCTQGKDRTGETTQHGIIQLPSLILCLGLVCALVLMILGIPISAIEHDYFLTDEAMELEREERLAEIREIGLTDEWRNTAKDMITGIAKHLDVSYGGLEGYLDLIGFGEDKRVEVREALLY